MAAATSSDSRVITGTCDLQGASDSESFHDLTELGDSLAAPARSDSPSYKRGLTSAAADPFVHPQLWIKGKRKREKCKVLHDRKGHAAVRPHTDTSLELFLSLPSLFDTSAVFCELGLPLAFSSMLHHHPNSHQQRLRLRRRPWPLKSVCRSP